MLAHSFLSHSRRCGAVPCCRMMTGTLLFQTRRRCALMWSLAARMLPKATNICMCATYVHVRLHTPLAVHSAAAPSASIYHSCHALPPSATSCMWHDGLYVGTTYFECANLLWRMLQVAKTELLHAASLHDHVFEGDLDDQHSEPVRKRYEY